VITTRLHIEANDGLVSPSRHVTKYESISHAIGELLEEGWSAVTFQCYNVAILSDCAGDRLIIEVVR
jgi:hypothetical protein